MKDFKILTKEVLLSNKKASCGCETFVYEPSNIEEESLGNLYILGKVEKDIDDLEFLPNLIASVARREFFKSNHLGFEASFEGCLKKINSTLLDLEKEHPGLRGKISFCIINIKGNIIQFSKIGNYFLYLLRGSSLINIGGKKERKKTFSAVVSGDIVLGDKFIFGTGGLENIFSDKSISGFLSKDIKVQADTIYDMYTDHQKTEKKSAEVVILLDVISPKNKKAFKKIFKPAINTKKQENKETFWGSLNEFYKNNKIFVFILFLIIILFLSFSFYTKINSAYSLLKKADAKIEEAKEKPKEKALSILSEAKNLASSLYAYPFFSDKAKIIEKKIEKKIEEVNGIYNITELNYLDKINGKSFGFNPEYIYEADGKVYVFGLDLNAFYFLKEGDKNGSFIFLDRGDFDIQRSFQDESGIYFINYKKEMVYRFNTEDYSLDEVVEKRKKRKILRSKPTQFDKVYNDTKYEMEKNVIIKKGDNYEKKLNFLTLIRIKSFTVSGDDKNIYILSERKIFKTENR